MPLLPMYPPKQSYAAQLPVIVDIILYYEILTAVLFRVTTCEITDDNSQGCYLALHCAC